MLVVISSVIKNTVKSPIHALHSIWVQPWLHITHADWIERSGNFQTCTGNEMVLKNLRVVVVEKHSENSSSMPISLDLTEYHFFIEQCKDTSTLLGEISPSEGIEFDRTPYHASPKRASEH